MKEEDVPLDLLEGLSSFADLFMGYGVSSNGRGIGLLMGDPSGILPVFMIFPLFESATPVDSLIAYRFNSGL